MITPSFGLTATERVLPKLALDFTTASLDNRITFTRTTDATHPATYINSSGYITASTNNAARFDYDPVTLACKGLLIEESRTNSLTSSEDIVGTFVSNSTYSLNAITSPANTLTADKLIPNNGAVGHFRETFTFLAASYTASIFAKKGEWKAVTVGKGGVGAYFDLDSGTIGTVNSGYTAAITSFGNGWYRCSVTFTAAAGSDNVRFYASNSTSTTTNGDGTSGIYVWGWQLEAGAFATSYIPTTTTALTRNADVATMTGTNFSDWFNASEGAAVVQALPSTISGTRPAIEFDDNTANQAITLRGAAADPQLFVVNGGAAQATLDAGTIAANAAYKLGGAWKSANFAAAVNGGASVSHLSGTYPTVTQARLGSDGTNYLNGCLQNLRYWPQRVTNAETQAFSK